MLAEQDHPVHALLDQGWLTAIVAMDVSKPSGAACIDRVLDLYRWFDLHQPEVQLD